MIFDITVPLVGVVDSAVAQRFNDPAFNGGVGTGIMEFNFMYFGLGFLRMGAISPGAQIYGPGIDTAIAHLHVRDFIVALSLENVI